jgi:hypothetical protein
MGQVFQPTFVDKNANSIEVMRNPILEWKLMEQCWCGGTVVSYVYARIKDNPQRLAWVGDQASYPEIHLPWFEDERKFLKGVEHEVFYIEDPEGRKRTQKTGIQATEFLPQTRYDFKANGYKGFLINHTLKLYLNLEEYTKKWGIQRKGFFECMDPLPLLTATGGHVMIWWDRLAPEVTLKACGLWAYSEIEFSEKKPQGYKKENYCFVTAPTLKDIYEKKYGRTEVDHHVKTPNGQPFRMPKNDAMENMNHQHEENEKYADELWAKLKKLKPKVRKTKDSPARKSAK